ncbi:PQQ-binding-like beta-propeller repeat protein [bacterium]|nr:PQQ-binding-like beta-propeller repeat protein [bacterium]
MKHLIIVTLALGAAVCCADSATDALAAHLLSLSGVSNGLCVVGTAGDLAPAIAQRSACLVVGHESDPAQLAAARAAAETAGTLGRNLYIAQGSATNMALAEDYANLLLISDLTDSRLDMDVRGEVARVLAPYGGKAVVGHAVSAPGALGEAALSNWAAQLPAANCSFAIVSDAVGLWAVITRGALPGGDDWGHWYHEPDNNPMSRDTALSAPFFAKWFGKRYQETPFEIHVCAGGRLFSANAGTDRRPGGEPYELVARSAQNGSVLWKRPLSAGFGEQSSLMVATASRLYAAVFTNVVCFDAAYGTTVAQFSPLSQQMRVLWIAVEGDTLYALGRVVQAGNTNSEIAAYNTVASTTVWRYSYAGFIDPRMTAMAGGNLYFYTGSRQAGCLRTASGALGWLVQDTSPLSGSTWSLVNYASSICTSNAFYVFPKENSRVVAYAATDGHVLWQTNRFSDWWLLVDGKLRTQGSLAFDATSGAQSTVPSFSGSICGHYSGSPEAFYSQSGRAFDRTKNVRVLTIGDNNGMVKSGCGSGNYVADGLFLSFPHSCWCTYEARGYVAQCPETNAAAVMREQGPRVEVGAGGTGVGTPLPVDNLDWWTYRANNARSGSTAATVPAAVHLLWQYTPPVLYKTFPTDIGSDDADEAPCPAAAAGGIVAFGGSDGIVRCINAGTGSQMWSYATGGRIMAAPTIRHGRVYVGSADGHAYCFEAVTGRFLWRFRSAAMARSIMVYGHLMGSWPVNGGITVHDGLAYFSAGVLDHNDVFAFALDAVNGTPARQWLDIGNWNTVQHRGAASYGHMAVVGGRVWMRGGNAPMPIFDCATGIATQHISLTEWLRAYDAQRRFGYATNRGKDIGVIGDRHLVYGGRLLYIDQSDRSMVWQGGRFCFIGVDAQGKARFPEVHCMDNSAIPPVWDGAQCIVARSGNYNNLECWSTASLTSFIDSVIEANKSNPSTPYYAYTNVPASVRIWGPQSRQMNAVALAGNAVIVAYTKGAPSYGNWYVTALDRANGGALWEYQLPAEPIFDGITIDRNGTVIVMLRNGRVAAYGNLALRIATPSVLPPAGVGTQYSMALQAVGGAAPYTWSLQGGSLPNGLDLGSNGVVSGIPVTMQSNTFTARVTDAVLADAAQTFMIDVTPEPVQFAAWVLAALTLVTARKRM